MCASCARKFSSGWRRSSISRGRVRPGNDIPNGEVRVWVHAESVDFCSPSSADTVHGQYGKLRSCENPFLGAGKFPEGGFSGWVLSGLLSVLASEQGVFYRQYGL